MTNHQNKLFSFIFTLGLVVSLGGCSTSVNGEKNKGTTEEYAVIGNFVDSDLDNSPSEDSVYYIPKGTTTYTLNVQTSEVENPVLAVVYYGSYDVVLGYSELNSSSEFKEGENNYILLESNTSYRLTLTFNDPSLKVKLIDYEINTMTDLVCAVNENHNYYAESYYFFYQSNSVENTTEAKEGAYVFLLQGYGMWMYATEDALLIQYISGYGLLEGSTPYFSKISLYVNNDNNTTSQYEINWWADEIDLSPYNLALAATLEGRWEDNVSNIGDLEDYNSAFNVSLSLPTGSSSYGTLEEYSVDDNALNALIDTTIGNNYIWDSVFYYYGFDNYFGDKYTDYFTGLNYYSGGAYTNNLSLMEIALSKDGWYYDSSDSSLVLYQQVSAYTDIYMSSVGQTEIPEEYNQYLNK